MAQRNTILLNTDPIIGMVRLLHVALAQQPPNPVIRQVLNDFAFPRIRMRMMTATKSKIGGEGAGTNEGMPIWFDDLSEMAVPANQAAVDSLIDTMITGNPLVRDGVYAIAARLGAAALVGQLMGHQIKPQAEFATNLETQAMADLEKLIRTPIFEGAAQTTKETKLKEGKVARIYMALDVDDSAATYNVATNEGQPFNGAQEVGIARLWIGTQQIQVNVAIGDKPADVMANLAAQWRLLTTVSTINVVIGPNEGTPVIGTRLVDYLPGGPSGANPAVRTNLGYLLFSPYLYDKSIDFLNVTLELLSESAPGVFTKKGIKGLLYGTEGFYSGLTQAGPHSIMIDLETGERTSLDPTTDETNANISDTFYFALSTPAPKASGTVTVAGVVVPGELFSVSVAGVGYTHAAGAGDDADQVAAELANLIDASGAYVASAVGGVITITAATGGVAGNSVTLTTNTTSVGATLTPSGATLAGGSDPMTSVAGQVKYRSQEMVDPRNPVPSGVNRERIVPIPAGSTALDVVVAVVNDMATMSATSRILGAIRAPTFFVIQGTPSVAPGLTVVPYTRDLFHYNVVFDILNVPSEVLFAALPSNLMADPVGTFDNQPKSLVLPARYISSSSGSTATPAAALATDGRVTTVTGRPSRLMQNALDDIQRNQGGL